MSQIEMSPGSSSDMNRKRKNDDENNGSNSNGISRNKNARRANSNNSNNNNNSNSAMKIGPDECYLKLLMPSYAAGAVIGRGGEKIAQLQKEYDVRMKMSKANSYYPGTNERICLVIGTQDAIYKVHDFISSKISEKPDSKQSDDERLNQIKLLVSNNSAGSLIGKGGNFIKQIKDESGAFVQISQKQNDLIERIVTIEGDEEKRKKALDIIMKKICEDPQYDGFANLSYSDAMTNTKNDLNQSLSAASTNNGLLGYPNNLILGLSKINELISQNSAAASSAQLQLSGLTNLNALIINCGGSMQMTPDNLKISLRNIGYNPSAINEIVNAISTLANYGLITKSTSNQMNTNVNTPTAASNTGSLTSLMSAKIESPKLGATNINTNQSLLGNNLLSSPNVGSLLQLLSNSLRQ